METNPLQQLRDIHLPADPSWWPPAFGWWLILALLLGGIGWLVISAWRAHRRRAPLRAAQALLQELRSGYEAGNLSAEDYLHEGNAVLKRLLVRALGRREYAELSGAAWLEALNHVTETSVFTDTASAVLGDARFSRAPQINLDLLDEHLHLVVAKVQP